MNAAVRSWRALPLLTSAALLAVFAGGAKAAPFDRAATSSGGGDSRTSASAADAEIAELRTAFSRSYRNDDGTFTTSLYTRPVNYRGADGRWFPIDSALVATDEPGYAWRNRANSFHAYFKSELSDDFLGVRVGGGFYRFSLEGAARSAGVAVGRRVHYANAVPGVELRYDAMATGVKETLVLAGRNAPPRYRFFLTRRRTRSCGRCRPVTAAGSSHRSGGRSRCSPLRSRSSPRRWRERSCRSARKWQLWT